MSRKRNSKEDVWKYINKKGENDCWEWQRYKNIDGYGIIKIDYITYLTHRIVWELIHGSISEGMFVLHSLS